MSEKKTDLLQGTLDLLVLKMLTPSALCTDTESAQKILLTSKQVLDVQQGSLYPALHRLERKGFVSSEWRESENGRMAKEVYSLTRRLVGNTWPTNWLTGRAMPVQLTGSWRLETRDPMALESERKRPGP